MIRFRYKFKLFYVFVFIISLMLFSTCFIVKAEDSVETKPTIYSEDKTVTQGDYFYPYIKAKDFKNIGSLELFIYYDSSKLTLNYCNTSSLLSNEFVSINTDTIGEIKVYVASINGISGSGNLLRLSFRVNDDALIGNSKVNIAVGDANLTDLSLVNIETNSFNINIKEKDVVKNIINFSSNTIESMSYNKSFTVKYYVNGVTYNFSSAEFNIAYDANLLKYESISIGNVLNKLNGSLVSVNASSKGNIKVSFAALEGVPNYISESNNLFEVKFTVINNVDDNAFITLSCAQMYDIELNDIHPQTYEKQIKITKVLPNIGFSDYYGYDNEFELDLVASKELNLAAGDFVIDYSKYNLSCIDVEKTLDSSMIVYNIIKDENGNETGKIKLSFLYSGGITENQVICKIIFKPKYTGNFSVTLSGTGLKDGNYKDIDLSYIDKSAKVSIEHKYEKVEYLAPTCTNSGHEAHNACVYCGYSSDKVTISSLGGHLYEYHNAKSPTCTENGWYSYNTCSRCDYTTYNERPKLGHNYNSIVTNPTCEDKGYTCHTCSRCNDTFTDEYVDEKGHNYGEIQYVWNSNYSTLTAKRVCLNDSNHIESETVQSTYTIVKKSTCLEDGLGKYESKGFKNVAFTKQTYEVVLTKLGHDLIKHSSKDATCTEIGWDLYYTCSRCDYSTYKEISPLGHDYSFIISKPTCTEDGFTTHNCNRCNDKYIDSYVERLNHNYDKYVSNNDGTHYHICKNDNNHIESFNCNFGDWIIITNPGEFTDGLKKRICCDCNYVEELVIPCLHEHIYSNVTVDKEPSCTDSGLKSRHCTINNCADFIDQTIIPKTGHNYIDIITSPTCLEDGYTTHTCDKCNEEFVDSIVSAIGHKYGEVVYTWSDDHLMLTAKHICINDQAHFEEETVKASYKITKEASCEMYGSGLYTSDLFINKSFSVQTYEVAIEKIGHNYSEVKSNNDSTHSLICANDSSHINIEECKFGEWVLILAPGAFTMGLEERKCSICLFVETRDIPELHEHIYSDEFTIDKNATCTERGIKSKHCIKDNCNSVIDETIIEAIGHSYGEVIYEWQNDYSELTACTTCLNDSSHPLTEIVSTSYSVVLEPSCTENGTGIYVSNEFKNKEFEVQTTEVSIDALGHNLIHIEGKPATCTEIGWDAYDKCSNCNFSSYVEIARLDHDYELIVTEPSCIEEGYTTHTCVMCKYEYVDSITNALGHNYNNIVTLPTCTEEGYTTHICNYCDSEYIDSYTSKINHIESDWIIDKEATKKEEGSKHTECTECGEVINKSSIPTIQKSGCKNNSIIKLITLMNVLIVCFFIRRRFV